MGVQGLTGILSRYAPNSIKTISCSSLTKQTIAFDASCHLNKFIYGDEPHPHRHIYGFYLLARFCDLNQINPIFVFDGPNRIAAKELEHQKRQRQRAKVKHSLVFEQKQSGRLDSWLRVSNEDNTYISKDVAITILSKLGETLEEVEQLALDEVQTVPSREQKKVEAELYKTAQDLRMAIEVVDDTEKYTKTVKKLANREKQLISDLMVEGFKNVKPALQTLKKENQNMLSSLEKRSVRITQNMRDECKEFLTTLGYVCFTCDNHEAEAMCAHLGKAGRTVATVSEDMDTLVFGDVPILRYFFSRGRPIISIDPIVARKELGMSRKSFVDFCILCGTDFSGTIHGIGPHRALKAIQTHKSIERLLSNLGEKNIPQETFNYKLARKVFKNLPPIPVSDKDYEKPPVNPNLVRKILEQYEIDGAAFDSRLKLSLLQQTVLDYQAWGNDPFKQNYAFNNEIKLHSFY